MTANSHFDVLILGAGAGGISMAARLAQQLPAGSVAVMDPSQYHFYQPLWTLVGAGVVRKEVTRKPQADCIPTGVEWIREPVKEVLPREHAVISGSGRRIQYKKLIVATGLVVDYAQIKGLDGFLGRDGVCSIYQYDGAEKTAEMLNQFQGGTAIFTMPPVPIKCAGAPQKIMYLADEIFRRHGVREKSKIIFATAGKVIFGVPEFAQALMKVVERKGIEVKYAHRLTAVSPATKTATFDVEGKSVDIGYDLLHVVPPMKAHDYIRVSGLAATEGPAAGWLKVDKHSLQSPDFPDIFGIGDVTGVPNSKTGAAIRKQAPVVAANVMSSLNQKPLAGQYDGYSSCPLVTGFGKVVLAEFGYDNRLMPSFPFDQTKERRSMWHLKKDLLPTLYWKGMLKGRA